MKSGCSHTMSFPSGRLTTTQQIMDEMLNKLGIPKENEQAFSLWLTSKHLRKSFRVHNTTLCVLCMLIMWLHIWSVVCRLLQCLHRYFCTELQLKSYHLPCKLFKRWKDLLSQYTTANYDDVHKGKLSLLYMGMTTSDLYNMFI